MQNYNIATLKTLTKNKDPVCQVTAGSNSLILRKQYLANVWAFDIFTFSII